MFDSFITTNQQESQLPPDFTADFHQQMKLEPTDS